MWGVDEQQRLRIAHNQNNRTNSPSYFARTYGSRGPSDIAVRPEPRPVEQVRLPVSQPLRQERRQKVVPGDVDPRAAHEFVVRRKRDQFRIGPLDAVESVRDGGAVERAAQPDALDATAADLVFEADAGVLVADTDYVGRKHLRGRPGVAVDEADGADAHPVAVGDVDALDPRLDVAVVVPLYQGDGDAVGQRLDEHLDLAALGAAGAADRVHKVAQHHEPIGVGPFDEVEHALAALLGAALQVDAPLRSKGGLDAGVNVRDHEPALLAEVGGRGRCP